MSCALRYLVVLVYSIVHEAEVIMPKFEDPGNLQPCMPTDSPTSTANNKQCYVIG